MTKLIKVGNYGFAETFCSLLLQVSTSRIVYQVKYFIHLKAIIGVFFYQDFFYVCVPA